MSPSETSGDFDDLEPIQDGADLEPLLEGDDLEPIEVDTKEHVPEAEPTADIPLQEEEPEHSQSEPIEPEATPEPEVDLEAMLIEEDPPAEEPAGEVGAVAAAEASVPAGEKVVVEEASGDEHTGTAESAPDRKKPVKRELEKAPLIQLKAAQFLMIACFLPWADPSVDWVKYEIEKIVCVLGVFLGVQAQLAFGGEKAMGFMKGLVKEGPRFGVMMGFVVSLIGLAPLASITGLIPEDAQFSTSVLLEKLTLVCAGFTYVHIVGYRLGGGFNPLYSFAFTLPVIGGIPALLNGMASEADGIAKLLGLVGSAAAFVFGVQGVRALIIAMKEAKIEGEAKKKAAIEARRAARKAGKKVEPLGSRKSKG